MRGRKQRYAYDSRVESSGESERERERVREIERGRE